MKFFARQKFLFDCGSQITSQAVGIFNTSLMIYVASDKIRAQAGVAVPAWAMIVVAAIGYIAGTLVLGHFLDRTGALNAMNDENNARNNVMTAMRRKMEAE